MLELIEQVIQKARDFKFLGLQWQISDSCQWLTEIGIPEKLEFQSQEKDALSIYNLQLLDPKNKIGYDDIVNMRKQYLGF